MRKTFLFSILIFFFTSCGKDKFTTKPQLKYKSANTTVLNRNQTLSMTLSFTDAEGDLTGSVTVRKSVRPCPNGDTSGSWVQAYTLPEFPSGRDQEGDIIVSFPYVDLNPFCPPRNDTAIFKFVLRDQANNESDTAVSEPIIITN